MTIRDKIIERLDHLELLMGDQKHLTHASYVKDVMGTIDKFWSVLKEDEKDYLQSARWALDNKAEWKYD
jgi:hypothetical protein